MQFGDGDGDGGDDGFFRKVFKELYDAKAIQAVLQVGPQTAGRRPGAMPETARRWQSGRRWPEGLVHSGDPRR